MSCILAFDYGLKRTGVAVGNRLMKSATPQGTIAAEGDARFEHIAKRIKDLLETRSARLYNSMGNGVGINNDCPMIGQQVRDGAFSSTDAAC